MSSAAIEKAKKTGKKRNFKISSHLGYPMSNLLPQIDMVSRILTDYFIQDIIEINDYKKRKTVLYEYIEAIDHWVEVSREFFIEIKGGGKLHYKGFVQGKKIMFLNTQVGMDAFHSFARCDMTACAYMQAMRNSLITEIEYKKRTDPIGEILDNFKKEVEGLKKFTWMLKKSSSRK